MTNAQKQFVAWLQANYPAVYQAAKAQDPALVGSGFAKEGEEADSEDWTDRFGSVIDSIVQGYRGIRLVQTEDQLLRQNVQRAGQGKPPISMGQVSPLVSSYTPFIWAGIGLAALYIFKRK